jgi:MFS family permease
MAQYAVGGSQMRVFAMAGVDATPEGRPSVNVVAGAGGLTMVALCFANGLQGGANSTYSQATDVLKQTFHVNDAALGVVPFGVSIVGNVAAIWIAALCARHPRTKVLAGMFVAWGVLIALAGLAPSSVFGFAAIGFALFAIFRIASAALEATDPAAYPLIADWWPVEQRAAKMSVFNTLSAVGAFGGLIIAGLLVDNGGWRWAFLLWLPIALVGAALIRSRQEPQRGAQDAVYGDKLEEETTGPEPDLVVDLGAGDVPVPAAVMAPGQGLMTIARAVARLRSWRMAALGFAISGLMGNALMTWGIPYFKRTFGLSGSEAAGLAPVLGVGAFAGVLGGGFLADRLLAKGMLRARLYVTAVGFAGAGVFLTLGFSTTHLAIAAPLLAVGTGLSTLPMGPQYALMMDVTPAPLRSQASAALNVMLATGALGALLVGGLSTLFGENLRLALLCLSPAYLAGAAVVMTARRTYVEDVALVVAEAKAERREG